LIEDSQALNFIARRFVHLDFIRHWIYFSKP
jgi:hypothetical protein